MTSDFRAHAHGPVLRHDGFGIRRCARSNRARCVRLGMASFGRAGGSNRGSDRSFGIAMQAMTFRELRAAARVMIARKSWCSYLYYPEGLHCKAATLPRRFRFQPWCEFRDAPRETRPTGSVGIGSRNLKGMPRPVPRISKLGRAARGSET